MEIKNKREDLFTASVPPEIVDASVVVKKTDYATASKAGVVKIGDNINVASGKISVPAASDTTAGVVKAGTNLSVDEDGFLNAAAGGITVDKLWSGSTSATYTSIKNDLLHTISDYRIITVCTESVSGTEPSYFAVLQEIGESGLVYAFKNLAKEVDLAISTSDVQIRNTGSGSLAGVTLYGIK